MAIKYVDKDGLTYFYGKLENRFATKNAIGSPLVASTAAGMTDTSKVYVYVGSEAGYTSGNWYYYNGSAWTSGGVYNSTAFQSDTTLSVSGAAADAKTAGDKISDLKSALSLESQLESNGFEKILTEWENGRYSSTTGNKVSSSQKYWVRTIDAIDNDKTYRIIKLSNSVIVYVVTKDSNDIVTYRTITSANIEDGTIVGDGVTTYKVFAGYYPEDTIEITNVTEFVKNNVWIAYEQPQKASKVFTAKQFGAIGDGVSDDTNAINDAILTAYYNGGGTVFIESGIYLTSAPIIIRKNVSIAGADKNNTIIKLKAGSNCNVMETYRYNLQDVYNGQEWYPMNFSIENLQIDGSATFTYDSENDLYNVSGNTAGSGIRIRGSRYILKHLYIHNVAKCGITFNYRSEYIYDTINDASVFNNSYIDDVGVFASGCESFVYNTANDLNIGSLWLTRSCLTKTSSGFIVSDTNPSVLCALYVGCNLNINFIHVWNNPYSYGVKIQNGSTVIFDTTVIESCAGGLFVDCVGLNLLWANNYMHNIGYEPINALPYVYIQNVRSANIANLVLYRDNIKSNTNQSLLIETDNVNISNYECVYKTATDIGDAIDLTGDYCKIKGRIFADSDASASTGNVKIVTNGDFIELDIDTSDIGGCEGVASKSVINVTGCPIDAGLIIDSNIINFGRGELI